MINQFVDLQRGSQLAIRALGDAGVAGLLTLLRRGGLWARAERFRVDTLTTVLNLSWHDDGLPEYNRTLAPELWIAADEQGGIDWVGGTAEYSLVRPVEGGTVRVKVRAEGIFLDEFMLEKALLKLCADELDGRPALEAPTFRPSLEGPGRWTRPRELEAERVFAAWAQEADQPIRKSEAREWLRHQFPTMPERAFQRVWDKLAPAAWRAPGRKPASAP